MFGELTLCVPELPPAVSSPCRLWLGPPSVGLPTPVTPQAPRPKHRASSRRSTRAGAVFVQAPAEAPHFAQTRAHQLTPIAIGHAFGHPQHVGIAAAGAQFATLGCQVFLSNARPSTPDWWYTYWLKAVATQRSVLS